MTYFRGAQRTRNGEKFSFFFISSISLYVSNDDLKQILRSSPEAKQERVGGGGGGALKTLFLAPPFGETDNNQYNIFDVRLMETPENFL